MLSKTFPKSHRWSIINNRFICYIKVWVQYTYQQFSMFPSHCQLGQKVPCEAGLLQTQFLQVHQSQVLQPAFLRTSEKPFSPTEEGFHAQNCTRREDKAQAACRECVYGAPPPPDTSSCHVITFQGPQGHIPTPPLRSWES